LVDNAIITQDLVKEYSKVRAVDRVSFTVENERIMAMGQVTTQSLFLTSNAIYPIELMPT
jgi:hypothetical protein